MKRVMALMLLSMSPMATWAAAEISTVTGRIADGEKIVVRGTDFGGGPRVEIFDDFEAGQEGQQISTSSGVAPVGSWTELNCTRCPRYSSAAAHGGEQSMRFDMRESWIEYLQKTFSGAVGDGNQVFGSWWLFLPSGDNAPGEGSTGRNWKQMWIQGHGGTDDDDLVVPTWHDSWQIDGNDAPYANWTQTGFVQGRWSRFNTWIRVGYDGDGSLRFTTLDKQNGYVVRENDQGVTILKPGGAFAQVRVNGYGRKDPNSHPTFDDIYFTTGANARARVEICDTSSMSGATDNCTLCTTGSTGDSWSDDEIVCTVRDGGFRDGDEVWLYVIDGDGASSQGYHLGKWAAQQGEDGPPPTPENLRRTDVEP